MRRRRWATGGLEEGERRLTEGDRGAAGNGGRGRCGGGRAVGGGAYRGDEVPAAFRRGRPAGRDLGVGPRFGIWWRDRESESPALRSMPKPRSPKHLEVLGRDQVAEGALGAVLAVDGDAERRRPQVRRRRFDDVVQLADTLESPLRLAGTTSPNQRPESPRRRCGPDCASRDRCRMVGTIRTALSDPDLGTIADEERDGGRSALILRSRAGIVPPSRRRERERELGGGASGLPDQPDGLLTAFPRREVQVPLDGGTSCRSVGWIGPEHGGGTGDEPRGDCRARRSGACEPRRSVCPTRLRPLCVVQGAQGRRKLPVSGCRCCRIPYGG